MERVKSWLYRSGSKNSDLQTRECEVTENRKEKMDSSLDNISHNHLSPHSQPVVDPKVSEYFKLFPEPYKSKAIIRFSSREGLYRWDFVRDLAMRREFEYGMRGKFLEDGRDYLASLKRDEEKRAEQMMSERELEPKEIPEWEKALRNRIPVHESETMGQKLFQTANLVTLGSLLLYAGVTLRKRKPDIPKWKHYMALVGSVYICGYCQVAAAYRLMDWGPFDRSVDDRDALTKQFEEGKQFFSNATDRILNSGKKS